MSRTRAAAWVRVTPIVVSRSPFSLAELSAAIAKLLERLNYRPIRKLPGSRRELFEQLDRPALRPLPAERYVFAHGSPGKDGVRPFGTGAAGASRNSERRSALR